ncbi:MAG TPA: 3'-5' exonuclease [Bacteroidales bacterium]|nr:3'-5' exonuclease [Bacteroidales bacterium]
MFRHVIDKDEINKLKVRHFEGEIKVVDSMDAIHEAMKEIRKFHALGFDTETKPVFKKGKKHNISLIQISNHEVAWLFRVNITGIPDALKRLLEDEAYLKIGVSLHDDMLRLRRLIDFSPNGFLDLQKYTEAFQIESKSLKKLVAIVLGFKISKSQQMSNWEADVLTEQQQRYAATDAWVSLKIYEKLRSSLNQYQ